MTSGDGWAGYFEGGNGLYTSGFKMPFGHTAGYVLTSDANGVGTWQALPGSSAWGLTGNAGTTAGTNFLGTTDDQPLELHVNSTRALRLEPQANSPNVIAGYSGNNATAGVYGASIGGGGHSGKLNRVTDVLSTVGGGRNNQAGDNAGTVTDKPYCTVGGGTSNTASGGYSTIAGGSSNAASGDYSTIAGGISNTASGSYATTGGGSTNIAVGYSATVAGGTGNLALNNYDTIAGGSTNTADGPYGTVGVGLTNVASGSYSTVPGGTANSAAANYSFAAGRRAKANHTGAFVWGDSTDADFASGGTNQFAVRATGGVRLVVSTGGDALRVLPGGTAANIIGGHSTNTLTLGVSGCTISGGGTTDCPEEPGNPALNKVTDSFCTIGGGLRNQAGNGDGDVGNAPSATVAGGWKNTASGEDSAIGGGGWNTASGEDSTVGGGYKNVASGEDAVVAGGGEGTASGDSSTIGGGWSNAASADSATVGGGSDNTASAVASTVPGGANNTAAGLASLAAGYRAKANHAGSFVWGDSTDADFSSGANNRFHARASGGVYLYSNAAASAGTYLGSGSGTWASLSDRAAKQGFTPVDVKAVLQKLVAIPITTWSYKASPTVPHIGPMAQDLHASFGLGDSDRSIATIDGDGLSMAAIQGLYQLMNDRLDEKQREIDDLKQRLSQLEAALDGTSGE